MEGRAPWHFLSVPSLFRVRAVTRNDFNESESEAQLKLKLFLVQNERGKEII